MKTAKDIEYHIGYGTKPVIIPKGTPVHEATNMPEADLYWVASWKGMNEHEQSWQRNYGFCITSNEVTE